MFVFPALNNNFKSRKRTFRCCHQCRSKRTKCDITSPNSDAQGCTNCQKHGWACSFLKTPVKKGPGLSEDPLSQLSRMYSEPAPKDMKTVNLRYLKDTFNFNTSGLDLASAYQYVFHDHPKAIIINKGLDSTVWHEAGVIVDFDLKEETKKYKTGGFGGKERENYIRNRRTYQYLLLIYAFTLSSPEFAFTADDITRLLQIYFFKVNSMFPMIHESRFWEDYSNKKAQNVIIYVMILAVSRDKMAEPILRSVFQRSRQGEQPTDFQEDLINFMKETEAKIRQILFILPELGDVDKLIRLIVLLILLMHFRYDRLGNEESAHDLTAALNLALSLGIHMKVASDKFPKERNEYCTSLWWCCFIFDRFNAVVNCRSIFVRHEDFNVDLPYNNPVLLRMVQVARTFENMLLAIYRPFDNVHVSGNANDMQARLKIFNPAEFQKIEFDICDREITSAAEVYRHVDGSPESLPTYVANTEHFLTRIINNTVILAAQKVRFSKHAIPGQQSEIIATLKSSANILWYVRQLKDPMMLNIPMVPWTLLIAMASFLKRRAKTLLEGYTLDWNPTTPKYDVEDFLLELDKLADTWFIVDEICNLSRDFITKLTEARKKRSLVPPQPSSTVLQPFKPTIDNIVHQPPVEYSDMMLITGAQRSEFDQYFDSMHIDLFDNDFFKEVPNVINILR